MKHTRNAVLTILSTCMMLAGMMIVSFELFAVGTLCMFGSILLTAFDNK